MDDFVDSYGAVQMSDSTYTVKAAAPRVALKTNLLFDAVGAFNFGVEYPFGISGVLGGERRFSATLDGTFANWRINNTYALQTLHGSIGLKYWFNRPRGVLTGWNAGIYGMAGGRWDVQWKSGWQGNNFLSAGISGGYAISINNKFNLEFVLTAGFIYTSEARNYRPDGDYLMWQQTRLNVVRFSLTGAQVNLVWLINGKEKSK